MANPEILRLKSKLSSLINNLPSKSWFPNKSQGLLLALMTVIIGSILMTVKYSHLSKQSISQSKEITEICHNDTSIISGICSNTNVTEVCCDTKSSCDDSLNNWVTGYCNTQTDISNFELVMASSIVVMLILLCFYAIGNQYKINRQNRYRAIPETEDTVLQLNAIQIGEIRSTLAQIKALTSSEPMTNDLIVKVDDAIDHMRFSSTSISDVKNKLEAVVKCLNNLDKQLSNNSLLTRCWGSPQVDTSWNIQDQVLREDPGALRY
ncbi:MAG: hypothetical protein WC748_03575 [Legionellales bacterium]|jgi:flagellin-like hook-associated protein FlgL